MTYVNSPRPAEMAIIMAKSDAMKEVVLPG